MPPLPASGRDFRRVFAAGGDLLPPVPDEPDPPRKVYSFKEREFKRDNAPVSETPPAPTAKELAKLAGHHHDPGPRRAQARLPPDAGRGLREHEALLARVGRRRRIPQPDLEIRQERVRLREPLAHAVAAGQLDEELRPVGSATETAGRRVELDRAGEDAGTNAVVALGPEELIGLGEQLGRGLEIPLDRA